MPFRVPFLKEIRVLFHFAQTFLEAWGEAQRHGLKAADLAGATTLGPETDLGLPLLVFSSGPGSATFVGPHGAGRYISIDAPESAWAEWVAAASRR